MTRPPLSNGRPEEAEDLERSRRRRSRRRPSHGRRSPSGIARDPRRKPEVREGGNRYGYSVSRLSSARVPVSIRKSQAVNWF